MSSSRLRLREAAGRHCMDSRALVSCQAGSDAPPATLEMAEVICRAGHAEREAAIPAELSLLARHAAAYGVA